MAVRPYKKQPGRWQIDWYELGKRKVRVFDGTRAEAEEAEREVRKRHAPKSKINPRIDQVYPDYLSWYKLHRAERSVDGLREAWKKLEPYFGKKLVTTITLADYHAFQQDHKKTPRYCNLCLDLFSGIIKWLCENYEIEKPPVKPKKLKYERPIPKVPSHDDVHKFIRAIRDPLKLLAVELMAFSGTRYSETLALRWEEIDLQRGTAILRKTKTSQRIIALSDDAVQLLTWMKPDNMFGNVFPTWKSMKTMFKGASARAKIQRISPHKLRHFFATRLVANTGNLRLTQVALGHKQIETTTIYTHIDVEQIKQAVK